MNSDGKGQCDGCKKVGGKKPGKKYRRGRIESGGKKEEKEREREARGIRREVGEVRELCKRHIKCRELRRRQSSEREGGRERRRRGSSGFFVNISLLSNRQCM